MRRLPLSIRRLGALLLGSVSTRIREGPNAGCKWSLVSAGRGYASGTFEADRVAAIVSLLRPGDRFWDIGAHKGYISLAAARAIGPGGQVVAMEPAAVNRALLERHIRWNNMENIRVVPVAVSDEDGQARFGGPGSSIAYQLGHGDEIVPTRTIRSLIGNDHLPAPDVLKIDAERVEAKILRGGLEYLRPHMLVWISLHSQALYEECRALLLGRNFRVFDSAAIAARAGVTASDWGGDKELLAVGSERGVAESDVLALRLFRVR